MFKIQSWIKSLTIGLAFGALASPALGAVLLTGVVYDSRTREPVQNAQVGLWNVDLGETLDSSCYLYWNEAPEYDPGTGQPITSILSTGANGVYSVVLEHGQHASCPDTVAPVRMEMRVSHPDYVASSLSPAAGGGAPDSFAAYGITARGGAYFVSDDLAAPEGWPPAPYWSEWRATKITTPILNHHIPLDARAPRAAELFGVVTDSATGAPIDGARVVVIGTNGQPLPDACLATPPAQRTVGADGAYLYHILLGSRAECPIGGTYWVEAQPPAGNTPYSGSDRDSSSLALDESQRIDLELGRLAPAGFGGVVTDSSTGSPIPGATVTITGPLGPLDSACFASGTSPQTTGANGAYSAVISLGAHASCPATGGSFTGSVAPPAGYQGSDSGSATLTPGSNGQADLELTPVPVVIPPAGFGGVVTDSTTGAPIPGAVVTITGPSGPLDSSCFASGTSPQTTGANGAYGAVISLGAHASCPATGGSFTASVTPPAGYQGSDSGSAALTPGSNGQADLELTPVPTAPPTIWFGGVVRDATTGEIIPGALVSLTGPLGGQLASVCFAEGSLPQTTGADGAYGVRLRLGADPTCPSGGRYTAHVEPPADSGYFGVDLSTRTEVVADGDLSDVDLALDFAVVDLRVSKETPDKAAAPGETVVFRISVSNTGSANEVVYIEDRPSPWLNYVAESFSVEQANGVLEEVVPFSLQGRNPIFGPITLQPGGSLRVGYAMRISHAAPPGYAENLAVLHRRDGFGRFLPIQTGRSGIIILEGSTVFDDSVVFGKVWYDCNMNGWQDQPMASRITLSGGFAPGALLPGGLTVDRGFGPEPLTGDFASGLTLGDLAPLHVGAGGEAGKIVLRAKLARPEIPALRLVTAEGFDAALAPDGSWTQAPLPGGFAGCGDLRMMRAVTPAPGGGHLLTIVITSGCRAESGVAGARLATVEGLVIETDSHGRYHIADGRFTDRLRGSNMLIKLDEASLPMGSRVVSVNPQRLRLTGGPMQAANFAVSCPAPQGFFTEQVAEIGAVCFLPGTASIDPAQAGALTAAAEHLLTQGGGEVVVECRPCEGKTDAALNAGRVAAVRQALAGMLPAEIMSRVTVRSETQGMGAPAHGTGGFSPVPAGGPTLPPLPLPHPAPQPEPSKGLFQMIFGSNATGAGPMRAFALAGALLGAQEAKADAPGAGKAVQLPLSRGVIETPKPQFAPPPFVGPMAPAPFCPTLGRALRPGEACPTPAPAPQPVVTGRYCLDTGITVPVGAACPVPQTTVVAPPPPPPPPPVAAEPPKPAFATRPREICPEAKCADVSVRSLVELPFGASLTAVADAQSADPRLDAVAPSAVLLAGDGLAGPAVFHSFSNYPTFIDRWEVVLFREADRNRARPLATLTGARLGDPVVWDGAVSDGRPLSPGENLKYVVRAYDSEGRRDETKPRDLLLTADPEHPTLKRPARSAYGRDSLARQSIPIMGGRVAVRGAGVPPGWLVAVSGEEIPVNEKGEFVWESLRRPGVYEIPVELAAPDGVVWSRMVAAQVPENSFFMVGLADLTIGQDFVSDSLEAAVGTDGFQEDVFANGRLAFYLKGKIQGRYLITAQADTHENEIEHIFDDFVDYRDPRKMFRRLDPDRYYPVYGDGSVARSDVDTQGKFYVRVEDGDSSLMWGNFNTGFTGTELARYERSLYGARAEYVSRAATSYGEARFQAKGFASQPNTAAAHNEFIGTGGSLYYLRQRDIVTGSEKLRVEIRDRDSGRVLESVALVPGKDYEINDIQGRVLLTNPLRSFAGRSGTNVISTSALGDDMVFLVADYEYVPDFGEAEEWTYGGRALAWLGDHLKIGGTYVEENAENARAYELMGADVALRWRPGTYIRGEWARSNSFERADIRASDDGGLTFHELSGSLGRPVEGDAFSIEARADFAEIFDGSLAGEAEAWWRERDEGYSNVQSALDGFRRSFGGSVELRPSEDLRLALRAHEGEYLDGDKERTAAAQIDKDFGRFGLSFESRYEEEIARGEPEISALILGGRLSYEVMDGAKVYVRGQTSVMEEGDYVDATGGAVGFSARLSDALTAHAEYAHFKERGNGATVGVDYQRSADHVVYGSYTHSTDREDERRHAFTLGQRANVANGLDVYQENLFGVRRDGGFESSQLYGAEIRPLDDLSLGLSYQRSDLDLDGGDVERDAVSASARWKTSRLELAGKAEYRRDRGEGEDTDQWLATARAKYEATPSTTLLAKASVSHTDNRADSARDARFWEASVGLAYRPVENDRLNLLARYSYLYDLPAPEQVSGDVDQRAHLVSAEASYRVTPRLTFGAKGAYKHGEIREDRNAGGWTATRLTYGAAHAKVRIFENWDAMAEWRVLHDLEADMTRHGALVAVYRRFGDNFELGAGYNFAAFGDDLFDLNQNAHGWFINAVGKF